MLRKLSSTFKVSLAAMFAVLSSGLLQVLPTYAYSVDNPGNMYEKVYVCKYVGTPGVDERLQTGGNPISVSTNALKGFTGIGSFFNDQQGRSVAIAWDNGDKIEPPVSMCPSVTTEVSPQAPAVNDACGTASDSVTLPETTGITYSQATIGLVTTVTATAQDNYTLVAANGYTLNQDGTATYVVTLTDTPCEEAPTGVVKCENIDTIHATNLDQQGWTLGDGASYVDGGVKLSTPGSWTSSSITRTLSGELRDLGSVIDYTPDTQYLGLHVKTELGTLVYEHIYGGNWWLDTSDADPAMVAGAPHNGGGQGSPYYGTLDEWVALFPELKTTMLTVLYTSPAATSTTLSSVTINCTKYTFDREDVVTPLPSGIADICGVGNDVVPHKPTDFYTIVSDTEWQQDGNDPVKKIRTITYQARDGLKFPQSDGWVVSENGKTASYTYTDWGTSCADVCKTVPVIHATNLDTNGWTLGTGAVFVEGGVKMTVLGNWGTSTMSRDMTGNLSALGNVIDFLPNQDFLGLHVETSAGTLVYEKYYENQNPANAGKWWSWSGFNVSGGMGYPTFDTLDNIIAANPGVSVSKVTVLYTSPVPASATVTSVKIACQEFTFDLVEDVVPTKPEAPKPQDESIVRVLAGQPQPAEVVPALLPQTGATGPVAESANALWVLLAGLMTYAALYFAQPRRETNQI